MSAQGYFADSGHEAINQGIVLLCQQSKKRQFYSANEFQRNFR